MPLKIEDIQKDINAKNIILTWTSSTPDITNFKISYALDDRVTDYKVLGYSTNLFFVDTWNYEKTILNHRVTYKIEALNPRGETVDTVVTTSDTIPKTLLQRTMNILRRKAALVLRNSQWTGSAFLFKRRITGVTCPVCFSKDLKASANPVCPECFGQGYVGGFYDPIPTFTLPLQEQVKNRKINEKVATSYDLLKVTMPSFPIAREGDYLYIENEGWFQVTGSTGSAILSKKTATHVVDLTLLDPKDPIYKFPVDKSLSQVSGVSLQVAENSIIIQGSKLIPVFGETKLNIKDTGSNGYAVMYGEHLTHISDTSLAFKSRGEDLPSRFTYRLLINGRLLTGISQ